MTRVQAHARSVERVVRAHGGGGELMNRFLVDHVLVRLGNAKLNELTDGAVLESPTARLVFTTDSYVVQPLEFPGGGIGRLAVCGTVNDLAVMGGRPLGLSLGLIVEEGFELDRLDRLLDSIAVAAGEAAVDVVTGDTKVVERQNGDGLYINTAGVAALDDSVQLGFAFVRPGDAVVINGTIGDHGLAVLSVREGLEFDTTLESDAAPLNGLIQRVLGAGVRVRFMRDATRGGLAAVLADVAERSGWSVEIEESEIPCRPATRAAAELLGLDLVHVANEGKVVMVIDGDDVERCLSVLREHSYGRRSAAIGRVTDSQPPLVELMTRVGGRRIVARPYGEDLPRIC